MWFCSSTTCLRLDQDHYDHGAPESLYQLLCSKIKRAAALRSPELLNCLAEGSQTPVSQQEKRWDGGNLDLAWFKLLHSDANSVFHFHSCPNRGNLIPKTLAEVSRAGFCCYPIAAPQAATHIAAGDKGQGNYSKRFAML